ncbi:M48 family metallopeptidase [Deinococcus sp.]|uniref:M48 family metallopeptidase n=1 Tax=Deinococcus sp. TaxID=47478 RepID=UPI003CC5861E
MSARRPVASLPAAALLQVGGVSVELRRSERRRTVALKVSRDGAVLYAPSGVPSERLQRFLHERQGWLLGHLASFARRAERAPLAEGSELPLLGASLRLYLVPGLRAARQDGDTLQADPERLHAQLEAWYRGQALTYFAPLVRELASELGRPLRSLRLTSASGRWGSCSAAGDIRLHWRLLLAPERAARYVAAHEVAHLAQMNHSPRYWALLERLMPAYREPKRWLKDHGETLTLWD